MSVVVFDRWDLLIPHPWGPAPTPACAGVGAQNIQSAAAGEGLAPLSLTSSLPGCFTFITVEIIIIIIIICV